MTDATFPLTWSAPRLQKINKAPPTHSTKHLVITEQRGPNHFRVLNTYRGKIKFIIPFAIISYTQNTH